jgi:glucokinase|tara:strand:- start:11051 stop:11980 length:930 start_codon:yes stop_codon:yes gene_type:complete
MILLADIGATNARFCVTADSFKYQNSDSFKVEQYSSLEELCIGYLNKYQLDTKVKKAVIGVAAPIAGDTVTFVNAQISFSVKALKENLFEEGLIVVNDLALQANAIEKNIESNELSFIGSERKQLKGPKILVSPGTGLGLAGIVHGEIIATEAGHLNIPLDEANQNLKKVVDCFVLKNERLPTYEDFLSGKGICYFYEILSQDNQLNLSSEDILMNTNFEENSRETIELQLHLFASYLRYVALVWGSTGGVYISGSIANALIKRESYTSFRKVFEESETMHNLLKFIPLVLVKAEDIGFRGALELSKRL